MRLKTLLVAVTATFAVTAAHAQSSFEFRFTQKGLEATNQGDLGSLTPAGAFLNVETGTTATGSATLANTGRVPLAVSSITTGGAPSDYQQANNCPGILDIGATCVIDITFAPTTTGARPGQLTVQTNSPTKPALVLPLSGYAMAPPASLSLGNFTPGTAFDNIVKGQSGSATAVLTNTGRTPVALQSISASGNPTAGEFSQTNNCSASLPIGAQCTITVKFQPTAGGARNGTLAIVTDMPAQPILSRSLTGSAIAPSAALSTPAFAATATGSASMGTATLTNTGSAPVAISDLDASSVTGTGFSFDASTCGATLAVGSTCTVSVKFAPVAPGTSTGSLAVVTDAGTLTAGLGATAVQGSASLSTSDVAFGIAQVGSSTTQSVTVTNNGTAALTFSAVSLSSGAADYTLTQTCTAQAIAVGDSCSISATFQPAAEGTRSGTVTLAHNGLGATTIGLSGTGKRPEASLSTANFASTAVGSSSNATATLTNTGIGALSLTVPSAAAVSGANYSFVSTTCTSSLAAGASCTVTVKFSPTSTTPAAGALSLNTGAGIQSTVLGATGIQGFASVSPGSLAFGSHQVGSTSVVQSVTVTNIGTSTLSFTGVGISSGAADYAQSNNCATVEAGGTCTINVALTPTAAGARAGVLGLVHDGGGVATVSLSGTGEAPSGSLSIATFGTVQVGSATTATATLTNTGIGPLSLTVPSALNVSGADFAFVSTTCPAQLATGSACSTVIRFTPSAAGARSGMLAINSAAGSHSVSLSGTGQMQSATLSTPSFSATAVGSSSTATATLTNTGIGNLAVTLPASVTGASYSIVANTCTSSIAPGAWCSVTVRFAPTSTTADTGTLAVITGAGTKSVSLSSTGIQGYASMSPGSLTFASRTVGTTSPAQTITVTNTGTNTLTFTGIGIATGGTDYAQSNNCGSVAVGGTCTVNVTFTPAAAGNPRNGTLGFTHNGGGIATVSLTGSSTATIATVVAGKWSDGTYAKTCVDYRTGDATHTGATTDGTYSIKPVNTIYSVTCNMVGGGWTVFPYMLAGYDGFPGDGSSTSTARVNSAYLQMYQELGAASLYQRVTIYGVSEASYDFYRFLDYDSVDIVGTSSTSGTMPSTTLDVFINKNYRKSLSRTSFSTDGSVDGGPGAYVGNTSWFK
jgi:P pilus assembly chaperone PapD